MTRHKIVALCVLICLCGCFFVPDRWIYFIPIEVQNVGEITKKSIAEKAVYKRLNAPSEVRQHLVMAPMVSERDEKCAFDAKNIRLRVDIDRSELLVDANGVMDYSGYCGPVHLPYLKAAMKGLMSPERCGEISKLLSGAPGPSPWYSDHLKDIQVGGRQFHWTGERSDTLTEVGVEKPLLVARIYANVVGLGGGRLLVYGKEYERKDSGYIIEIYDVAKLKPITSEKYTGKSYREVPAAVADTEPSERVEIPNYLPEGKYPGYKSRLAGDLPELLLLANGPTKAHYATSIYVWHPKTGEVLVLPQTWFDGRFYDLGYEWITRVMRDPVTNKIIGSGIRLPEFELDEGGITLGRVFLDCPISSTTGTDLR